MAKENEHTFLVVTDSPDFLEEYRDWLDLYVKALNKFKHKADFGQIMTPEGKNFLYMSLQMLLTESEMNFREQMTKS